MHLKMFAKKINRRRRRRKSTVCTVVMHWCWCWLMKANCVDRVLLLHYNYRLTSQMVVNDRGQSRTNAARVSALIAAVAVRGGASRGCRSHHRVITLWLAPMRSGHRRWCANGGCGGARGRRAHQRQFDRQKLGNYYSDRPGRFDIKPAFLIGGRLIGASLSRRKKDWTEWVHY